MKHVAAKIDAAVVWKHEQRWRKNTHSLCHSTEMCALQALLEFVSYFSFVIASPSTPSRSMAFLGNDSMGTGHLCWLISRWQWFRPTGILHLQAVSWPSRALGIWGVVKSAWITATELVWCSLTKTSQSSHDFSTACRKSKTLVWAPSDLHMTHSTSNSRYSRRCQDG